MGGWGAGLETEDEPGASLPWKMAGQLIVGVTEGLHPQVSRRQQDRFTGCREGLSRLHSGGWRGAGLLTSGKPWRMYSQ